MAIPVIMPKQGQSVETCIITRWFKKRGDSVNSGDILFSYETDKAAFDMESPADGIILDIFYGEGAEVPVLVNVAAIGEPGESVEEFRNMQEAEPSVEAGKPEELETKTEPIIAGSALAVGQSDRKIRISPRAKRFAERNRIDYRNIKGSGPNGRILCGDLEKADGGIDDSGQYGQDSAEEFYMQPLSNLRKSVAKAMQNSLQGSAQVTHHMSADVRNLLEARRKIKDSINNGRFQQDITINDMVCWCVIRALEKHPGINSHFLGNEMKIFKRVHLGMAVDTERGLMVPAIKNASEMDLSTLSKELKSAAAGCRKANINPDLIQSSAASFTVSNLGNYGVEMFTPVINLPQVAILGVCSVVYRPGDLGNNTFGFIPFMGLSLTYDHRAVDGGPATLFLKDIKEQIEKFKYQES